MQRRETYATTGTRMVVRLFGGWDFVSSDATERLPAAVGYSKGVPMGGDLRTAPQGKSPTFLVAALKDSMGANLDRYQIVKGWLTKDGKLEEKVYDVVWSGNRKPSADGKVPTVGSTVDVANATYTNTIGAPELVAVWQDPQLDPAQRAFYYGRVIEIPDAALDRLRRQAVRREAAGRGAQMTITRTGLHLADLVHAVSTRAEGTAVTSAYARRRCWRCRPRRQVAPAAITTNVANGARRSELDLSRRAARHRRDLGGDRGEAAGSSRNAAADPFGAHYRATVKALERFAAIARRRFGRSAAIVVLAGACRADAVDAFRAGPQRAARTGACDRAAAADELVLVSGQDVIHAIANEGLGVGEAIRLGLIRAYGPQEKIARFLRLARDVTASRR